MLPPPLSFPLSHKLGREEKTNSSVSPFRKGRNLKKKKFFIKGDGDKMQELT